MADLSTLFPNVNIDQMGPVGGMMMGDMFNIAKQNAQINQQGAQAEQQRSAEMHPLDMAFKQAQTGYQTALGRQANASADKSVFDLEQAQRLKEPAYQAALAGFMKDTSEAEVKKNHADLEKQLMSPDPKVRAQAQTLYKSTGDMLKMYEQERLRGENAARVAQIGADGRIAAKNVGSGGAKPAKTLQEQYVRFLTQAEQAETPQEQQYYQQLADGVFKHMLEVGNARAPVYEVPNNPNLTKSPTAPGTATPTTIPPKPGQTPASASSTNKDPTWFDRAKKANPGMSDEQIRAEGQRLGKL